MKAHQEPEPPKPFRPVTLTLESQEEVDALHAMLVNCRLRKVLALTANQGLTLITFRDPDKAESYSEAVCSILLP